LSKVFVKTVVIIPSLSSIVWNLWSIVFSWFEIIEQNIRIKWVLWSSKRSSLLLGKILVETIMVIPSLCSIIWNLGSIVLGWFKIVE
jgi:hypothetical protein